jgi:hypothetical protein
LPAFTTYLIVDLEIVDGEYNVVEDRPLASETLKRLRKTNSRSRPTENEPKHSYVTWLLNTIAKKDLISVIKEQFGLSLQPAFIIVHESQKLI